MSQTVRETMSEAAGQAMSAAGEATSRKDRASRDGFNWVTATLPWACFMWGQLRRYFSLPGKHFSSPFSCGGFRAAWESA